MVIQCGLILRHCIPTEFHNLIMPVMLLASNSHIIRMEVYHQFGVENLVPYVGEIQDMDDNSSDMFIPRPPYVSPLACGAQIMSGTEAYSHPVTLIDCVFHEEYQACLCPPHLIQFALYIERYSEDSNIQLVDSSGVTEIASVKLYIPIQLRSWPTHILFSPSHSIPTFILECIIAPVDNLYVPIDKLYNLCREQSLLHHGTTAPRWDTGPSPTSSQAITFGIRSIP